MGDAQKIAAGYAFSGAAVELGAVLVDAASPGAIGGILAAPVFKSFARSAAGALGREITRDLFGTSRKRR
jgi:FAD/FMN-containing dehydrogenase